MHFGGLYENEVTGKIYDRQLMMRFLRHVRPYGMAAAATLLLLPLVAVARLGQPYIIKLAIDNHIIPGEISGLPLLSLWFLLLLLGEAALTFLQIYLLQFIGQRIMQDLRLQLFSHVQRLPVSYFDRTPTGSVVTRLTSDVEALGEMFAAGIISVVGDIFVLVGVVGIMLWMDVKLSLVTFSVLPLLIWVTFTFRRNMREAYREVRARLSNLNAFLAESIGGISIVQLFNRQETEQREFTRLNAGYRDANLPVITWDASLYALVEALASVAVGLIIWYGGNQILGGTLTFGALVAFIYYIDKFFSPIRDLSAKFSVMQGAMAALERIFTLLDTEPEPAAAAARPIPDEMTRSIEFRDVWFAYRGDEYVLKRFDLSMARGEKIALVGETGGGKTTVTRLLSRFYDVSRGSILLNGADIRDMPLAELRRKIGVVLQEPYLFSGSIAYNITLGDEAAGKRMERAAAAVGADRFIVNLPHGFNEEVRERGSNLSAGERQLISFARAVAFDPEILVLDEATASVDSASERLIQEGLRGLMAGRTSIVVAHRLSTVQDADRIVVVHRGEKVEEGTHQELLARRNLYYRLYQLQFRD